MSMAGLFLHGFGQRYDLPASLALYLFAAGGVVVISFVLVVMFASDQVGAKAIAYPRRAAQTPWPRVVGETVGVLGLTTIIVTGLFGPNKAELNPAEYLTWIYFWAGTVILSGLVGNLWSLLNPWAALHDTFGKVTRLSPVWKLPNLGIWPAVVTYFAFACLELTSGMANRPWIVAIAASAYTLITLAGMVWFGRDDWLEHCEAFTVLFGIVGRFSPVEAERDDKGRITAVYIRPWGVGLLQPSPTGWDRVIFVILMLSSLAFDGIEATPAWQNFNITLEPLWLPLGAWGFFAVKTTGLVLLTGAFLLIFIAFMELVIYFGNRRLDLKATVTAFALTLVPIALVYNAAHNYSYVVVQSQALIQN